MNIDNIWNNFLVKINEQITSLAYETWFKDTKLISLDNNTARILVPLHVHKKHLTENYYDLIESILNIVTGTNFNIEFILEEELNNSGDNIEIDVDMIGVPTNKFKTDTNLNSNYLFENFVVGDSNKFAHAAALAVSENPGKIYNPLFIYGKSGLGKTHLMHAIGNYINDFSNRNVLYVTSEQFISDFLNINKKVDNKNNFNYIEHFKNKYRNIDVLIIDDIQFLGNAVQTQQEFFHTFNKLYDDKKQIIISSDRSPEDLKILEERLRTRFSWGLSVNIFPPDLKLRKDILRKKIIGQGIEANIPDNVIEYISNNCTSDVRQLEGAITRIIAFATMMGGKNIDLDLSIDALSGYMNKGGGYNNSIGKIQRIVSEYYKITVEDMKSKRRVSNIGLPRQIAMFLCRDVLNESFNKIGIEFGGKDHTTVMHSVDKIKNEIEKNEELRTMINSIKQQIGGNF